LQFHVQSHRLYPGECAAVESVKAASDVYAPVSGMVSAVNEALNDQPKLINKSPYDVGTFQGRFLQFFQTFREKI
jgi:glycine cleavage system H lipoate-binding protein